MNWIVTLLGSVAATAAIFLLGFGILFLCGLHSGWARCHCFVVGLISFIVATLISPAVKFGVASVLCSSLFLILAARCTGFIFVRQKRVSAGVPQDFLTGCLPLAIGLAFNFCFLLLVFSCSGLTPDHLVQQYDNPFHFSVVRHILDTGNASPLGAGSVMGNSSAIYPDVWHSLVALLVMLFGLDMQTAGWIVVLAFVGFIAPIGFHDLYVRLQRTPSGAGEFLSTVLPVVLPLSALEFSYWGSLYANILGLCVVPAALSVILWCFDSDARLSVAARVMWTLFAFACVGFCHPNTVFVLAIFAMFFLVPYLQSLFSKIGCFVVGSLLWLGCCSLSLFSRTINCADRIGTGAEKGAAIISKLHLDYSFFVSNEWILWAVFAIGICLLVFVSVRLTSYSRFTPYVLSVLLLFGLILVAYFPQTMLSKYTVGFWYRDYKRLIVTMIFMGSLTVPVLFDAIWSLLSKRFNLHGAMRSVSCAAVSLVAVLLVSIVGARYYSSNLSPEGDCVNGVGYAQLTDEDRAFFSKVSDTVGSDVVLNNYNDSSVWLYSLYHVNALIKGRPANQITSMSDDLYTAVRGVALAGSGSAEGAKARSALRRLHVRHYLQFEGKQNTTTRFMPNGQIDYQPAGENSVVTDDTPGFEKVLSDGRYTLYELL